MALVEIKDLDPKAVLDGTEEVEGQETGGGDSIRFPVNALTPEIVGAQPAENGFIDRADSDISFTDGIRTFAIAPAVTSFQFYSDGTLYTKSAQETMVITDTEGMWFFYYNDSGVLTATQTFTDDLIITYALIAMGYWDATNNLMIAFGDERHGTIMDSMTHLYAHQTTGCKYGAGMQVADLVADGSGNVAASAQFSVTGGHIWDEDLKHTITGKTAPASVPFFYRVGAAGDWRKLAGTGFLCTTTGTGRGAYNQWTGSVWSLTEVPTADFFLMHLYATNDVNEPFYLIPGQDYYGTVAQAREAAGQELFDLELDGLPVVEYKSIASFIMQTSNAYTNAVSSRLRSNDDGDDYIDWRAVDVGAILSVQASQGTSWGGIAGTLSNQIDLQTALDEKIDGSEGFMELHESDVDPDDPIEGYWVMWKSSGLGASGDDGDIMVKITSGSVTKTITLIDFSAA